METGSSSCTNVIRNLASTCKTLLNPTYLTKYLQVLTGSDSISQGIPINVDQVFKLNTTGFSIQYVQFDGNILDSVFGNSTDCTCSGFLKEIIYKVYISPRKPQTGVSTVTTYSIDSIYADMVIQDQPIKQAGCGNGSPV